MFSLEQLIVIYFLVAEVIIVTLLIFATYGIKSFYAIREKKNLKKLADITRYLEKTDRTSPPPHQNEPVLLLKALDETKELSESEKSAFVATHVLPTVRPYYQSGKWLKRYLLVHAYQYHVTENDKKRLDKLIHDRRPVIRVNAIGVSMKLPDKALFKAAMDQLQKESPITNKIYIAQIQDSKSLTGFLREELEQTKDINRVILCYRILQHIGASEEVFDLALQAVQGDDIECKLAAIPVMAQANPEKAKNTLLDLLNHENWLIRNKAVLALGSMQIKETLDAIADRLKDENRWVQINAAKAMLNFGDEGRLVLTEFKMWEEAQQPALAAYFLDMHKMKEKL